jgi:hypothetical protein
MKCPHMCTHPCLQLHLTCMMHMHLPPLQVNKIRELPQHPSIVITHTDAPQLYVWNTSTQPNMQWDKVRGGCIHHSIPPQHCLAV